MENTAYEFLFYSFPSESMIHWVYSLVEFVECIDQGVSVHCLIFALFSSIVFKKKSYSFCSHVKIPKVLLRTLQISSFHFLYSTQSPILQISKDVSLFLEVMVPFLSVRLNGWNIFCRTSHHGSAIDIVTTTIQKVTTSWSGKSLHARHASPRRDPKANEDTSSSNPEGFLAGIS